MLLTYYLLHLVVHAADDATQRAEQRDPEDLRTTRLWHVHGHVHVHGMPYLLYLLCLHVVAQQCVRLFAEAQLDMVTRVQPATRVLDE